MLESGRLWDSEPDLLSVISHGFSWLHSELDGCMHPYVVRILGLMRSTPEPETVEGFGDSDPLADFTVEPSAGDAPTAAQATAFLLTSLALADHDFAFLEKDFILHALAKEYSLTELDIQDLVDGATRYTEAGRGALSYAEFIRTRLPEKDRQAIYNSIRVLIKADGKVEGIEAFLENRLRTALGI